MHYQSSLAHWVCLLAGLYLVLTGFLLRDIAIEQSEMTARPGVRRYRQRRAAAIGRRAVMVGVGLAAVLYGASRLLN